MKRTFWVGLAVGLMIFGATERAALAGQSHSWNLSRDMMNGINTNPKGTWAFMQNDSGVHDPNQYTLLPNRSSPCLGMPGVTCWADYSKDWSIVGVPAKKYDNGQGDIFVQGVPFLHPGIDSQIIIRWKSPIVKGTISVLGKASDFSYCGDGIKWSLETGSSVIQSGVMEDGGSFSFIAQNLPVTTSTSLYFIVGNNGTHDCDLTNIDMIITSQE